MTRTYIFGHVSTSLRNLQGHLRHIPSRGIIVYGRGIASPSQDKERIAMNLRTELISEIRTLAVTFTAGDQLRDWIEEATDQDIQGVLGSRVRTMTPAMARLEAFIEQHGYEDARGDDYDAQAILSEHDAHIDQAMDQAELSGPDADDDEGTEEAEGDTEEADEDEDSVDPKRMAEKLKRARARYEPTVAYTGRLSSNTGDELSVFLAGMIPKDVCYLADLVCIDETGPIAMFHWSKYEHLNPGSIRMNAGNKIRSRVKSGLVSLPQLRNLLKSEI